MEYLSSEDTYAIGRISQRSRQIVAGRDEHSLPFHFLLSPYPFLSLALTLTHFLFLCFLDVWISYDVCHSDKNAS